MLTKIKDIIEIGAGLIIVGTLLWFGGNKLVAQMRPLPNEVKIYQAELADTAAAKVDTTRFKADSSKLNRIFSEGSDTTGIWRTAYGGGSAGNVTTTTPVFFYLRAYAGGYWEAESDSEYITKAHLDSILNGGSGDVNFDSVAATAFYASNHIKVDDSLIVNTNTSDGGANYLIRARKDVNSAAVGLNIENQTAGNLAGVSIRLETNSAIGNLTLYDDGFAPGGVTTLADKLVLSSGSTSDGLALNTGSGAMLEFYLEGTGTSNLEGRADGDSLVWNDLVRIHDLLLADSIRSGGALVVTGNSAFNGQVTLDTVNGVMRAMDGAVIQDSLIFGTPTTDGGAAFPVQLRVDRNGAVIINAENQTAGTSAYVSYRLESNSAVGSMNVYDDGYTANTEFTDKLVIAGAGEGAIAIQATSIFEGYVGGATGANKEFAVKPDSSNWYDLMRVNDKIYADSSKTGINGTVLGQIQIIATGADTTLLLVFGNGTDSLKFTPSTIAFH